MTDLAQILQTANVRKALIVDDAYDEVPLASDLRLEAQEWVQFFEDRNQADRVLLEEVWPGIDVARGDELIANDSFVAALWAARDRLRPEHVGLVFQRYIVDGAEDKVHLNGLSATLTSLGLQCQTVGRAFKTAGADADILFIDLFLGSTQDDEAIQRSIDGVRAVVNARKGKPPLIVLMSRSNRLEDKRQVFRDECGLFESAFRIIRKADLADTGRLRRLLTRLATHYSDSLTLPRET